MTKPSLAAMLMLALCPFLGRGQEVAPERMRQVYEEVKTPFKYGVVIRG